MDNSDILFWLGLLALYFLRQISARKRRKAQSVPPAPPVGEQIPATVRPVTETPARTLPAAAVAPSSPSDAPGYSTGKFLLDNVLTEMRRSLGVDQDQQPAAPPELFYDSEERFETGSARSDDDFGDRVAPGSGQMGTFHAAKERGFARKDNFFDGSFRSSPFPADRKKSNADSRKVRKARVIEPEYHSPLETHLHSPEKKSIPVRTRPKKHISPRDGLSARSRIKEAFVLSEILLPPISRRPRDPRRPLS